MMLLKANIRIGSITTYDKLMWITVLAVVFMSASVQQIVNVFVCSIIDLPVNASEQASLNIDLVRHVANLLSRQSYQFN